MNINENLSKMICNNCGKEGHAFYQCKLPIISCGIVVFRNKTGKLEYLMNRRRHSYGYIDMIRGKYNNSDYEQINSLIIQMSADEKHNLQTQDFDTLWSEMWGDNIYQQHNEYNISLKKFNNLKKNATIGDNSTILLNDIIDKCDTEWIETEWEFPKGRRNSIKEKDMDCALREFEEETGISKENINIIENLITFEETFIGTNCKCYKNKYFLGSIINADSVSLDNFQFSEVSKLEWKTLEECLQIIRPENLEKKELITNINNVLQQFRLYL